MVDIESERVMLRKQEAELIARLDRGQVKVEAARSRGSEDLPKLEAFWIALLHEYEQVYDRLEGLGG